MSSPWRSLTMVLSLVPLVLSAQHSSNASGTLTVNGVTKPLRYAYAFHDPAADATRVLVTGAPLTSVILDAEAGLRDGRGESALRELVRAGEASAIELFVQPDGRMETVMVFDRGFPMPTPTSGPSVYWYTPYRMTGGWIGGRSRTRQPQEFFDTRWEYEVAYFAPVGDSGFAIASAADVSTRAAEVEARETPRMVPPGGGEEGAMYLAFFRNLEATNGKALLEQMTPAMVLSVAERMDVDELSPTDVALWAMSIANPPGTVEIIGGARDPEGTRLQLRRTGGHKMRFGTATLVKEEGAWKVAEQEWW
jgi:hypothetical protein